jgi:rhomboid protease GluP
LGLREDYIFWSLVNELSARYEYRLVTVSENHQEIWLENVGNSAFPVIRLMRYDLDWANWLKRDIDRTANNAEQIRKQLIKRPINILNIYVSAFLPVDEYEYMVKTLPIEGIATIHTMIFDVSKTAANIESLQQTIGKPIMIQIPENELLEERQIAYIKQAALTASVKKTKEEQQIFRNGKPFFTYFFIVMQVVIFALMELNGGSTNSLTLIQYGAKYSPLILQGEWWRFLTPMVVHIGMLHLLMNTLSLYFIGAEVERMYGRIRFLFVYVFSGFTGTLASFLISPSLSAGASGAIFGCFGALLYFGIVHPKLFFRTIGTNVIILIIINLGYGFSVDGIDNAGHIGGLIGGFLASAIVELPKSRKIIRQITFAVGTAILTVFLLKWGFTNYPQQKSLDPTVAQIAEKYIEEGKEENAYKLVQDYIKHYQYVPFAYFSMGNMEIKRGNFEQARDNYEMAIEQFPDMHQAHFNLALVYKELGNSQKAREHAETAIQLAPDDGHYKKIMKQFDQDEDGSF